MSDTIVFDTDAGAKFLSLSGVDLTIGCLGYGTTRVVGSAIAEVSLGSMIATGSSQTDANIVSYLHNILGTSGYGAGVKLPAGSKTGRKIHVINRGFGGSIKVYPPTGGYIDLQAQNAGITLASNSSSAYIHEGSEKWFSTT